MFSELLIECRRVCVWVHVQSKKPLMGIISEKHPRIINTILNIQQKKVDHQHTSKLIQHHRLVSEND